MSFEFHFHIREIVSTPSLASNLSILELFDFCISLRTLLMLSNDGYVARQLLHDQIKFSSSPFFIHDHNVVLMLAHCKQKFCLQPEQITLSVISKSHLWQTTSSSFESCFNRLESALLMPLAMFVYFCIIVSISNIIDTVNHLLKYNHVMLTSFLFESFCSPI